MGYWITVTSGALTVFATRLSIPLFYYDTLIVAAFSNTRALSRRRARAEGGNALFRGEFPGARVIAAARFAG